MLKKLIKKIKSSKIWIKLIWIGKVKLYQNQNKDKVNSMVKGEKIERINHK